MKYLLAILLASCASRPDAITGVRVEGIERNVAANGAEAAAMCLGLGFDLPPDPFAGVKVSVADLETAYNYRNEITIPAGLDDYEAERQLAHEFVHVALTRYRPRIADHHQYMEQSGICFGGCESMPQFGNYRRGCE
jgi:hypothetical protein